MTSSAWGRHDELCRRTCSNDTTNTVYARLVRTHKAKRQRFCEPNHSDMSILQLSLQFIFRRVIERVARRIRRFLGIFCSIGVDDLFFTLRISRGHYGGLLVVQGQEVCEKDLTKPDGVIDWTSDERLSIWIVSHTKWRFSDCCQMGLQSRIMLSSGVMWSALVLSSILIASRPRGPQGDDFGTQLSKLGLSQVWVLVRLWWPHGFIERCCELSATDSCTSACKKL